MKHGVYTSLLYLLVCFTFSSAFAQPATTTDSSRTFRLGEVIVLGRRSLDSASTSYGTQAASFVVTNAKAFVRLQRYVSLEGGVNNLFDRNYALAEGFPEPGRNLFSNLAIRTL